MTYPELSNMYPVENGSSIQIVRANYHRILGDYQKAQALNEGVSSVNAHVYTSGVLPNFAFVGLCATPHGVQMFRSEHSRTHSDVYIPRRLPSEVVEILQSGEATSLIMGGGLVKADTREMQELLSQYSVTWLQHPNDDYWGHMIMGFDPVTQTMHYGYTRDRSL